MLNRGSKKLGTNVEVERNRKSGDSIVSTTKENLESRLSESGMDICAGGSTRQPEIVETDIDKEEDRVMCYSSCIIA